MISYWIMRVFTVLVIVITVSVPTTAAPKVDFNGDGRADVFLRNLFTGDISAWLIGSSGVLQSPSYGTVLPSSGWIPLSTGDFNGDGRTDLLWSNIYSGEVAVWLISGSSVLQTAIYATVAPNSGWTPISFRDVNGDGRTDLLWYHVYTGDVVVWLLDGTRILQSASYGSVPPNSGWTPIGSDDFNGDGRTDLLWSNAYTGDLVVWLLDGPVILQVASYGIVPRDTGWTPIGSGDFNGDGRADLLWSNAYTGDLVVWLLDGPVILQAASYGIVPPNEGWTPISTGDFNGDGRTDLLWSNAYTGDLVVWLLDGPVILQAASYGTVPPNEGWTPVGCDDFNGDGRTDLLWSHLFTSNTATWLLDGSRVLQGVSYGTLPPNSVWQPHIPR